MISAIRSGCLEVVQTVLAVAGDCLAVRDADNFNTPLHFCAVLKGGAAIARLLISKGHRPTAPNRHAWTPIDFARAIGNPEVANLRIKPRVLPFFVAAARCCCNQIPATPGGRKRLS